jgi:zinc-binding in reverse transcriptase
LHIDWNANIFTIVSLSIYIITWSAFICLKIKKKLCLVQMNKILTKENLKKDWSDDDKCIFCNKVETIDHIFLHCSLSLCLWNWLVCYNNFYFNSNSIQKLFKIDAYIPYKDLKLCEFIRWVFFWVIWNEIIKLCFKGVIVKLLDVWEDL